MLIYEILIHIDAIVGKRVTVSGRLVVAGDDQVFLTSSPEVVERQAVLRIRDGAAIIKHLLLTLPAYVGGSFLYDEQCIITGTVQRGIDSLELRDVQLCRIRRDGLEIEIPIDESPAPS